MFGCYKIKILDKNNTEKKSISQKNSITPEGKKKILDMLSYNPTTTFGYKKANIANGTFTLESGEICRYKTSLFGWKKINHPFNFDNPNYSSYKELSESEIARQIITENNNLTEEQSDRILKIENNLKVDWGCNNSKTEGSNNGYTLNSYKVWFNIGIGMVDQEETFDLSEEGIINADNEITLLGNPIYPKTVELISTVVENAKPYTYGDDYIIDYSKGILTIKNEEIKNAFYNKDSDKKISNVLKITYTWNGARHIDELKNGICGIYINAQPSIKSNCSSIGANNYFGMGTFSYDNGENWEGYSFPWKGIPLKEINKNSNDPRSGMNLTSFYSTNTEFEHYFPTFPYTFINPTNFSFAFSSDGENSFFIKNLNFLVPDFPPFTLQEIGLISDAKEIKKSIEWSGMGEDDTGTFAEWKAYLDTNEGNGLEFKSIKTYFNNNMKNQEKYGWNEMEYPESGKTDFSEADFTQTFTKGKDELIEISYRIYFSEDKDETSK